MAEPDPAIEARKEGPPCAEDDRMDQQPVLVDEATPDEFGGEGRAADLHVAVELLLEPLELLADVATGEPAVSID